MKHLLKPTLIATVLALSATNTALASGIPTVDAAGIATTISENLKTLEQLKQQLDAAHEQINQYKQFADDTKRRLEGNWNLGSILNGNSAINSLPSIATDFINLNGSSLDMLRNQYGLISDDVETQKLFDKAIAYAESAKKAVSDTEHRIKNLKTLENLMDSAQTPAQKADVANKFALEKMKYEQEKILMEQIEQSLKKQEQLKAEGDVNNFFKKLENAEEKFIRKFQK